MGEVQLNINGKTYGISCDDGQEGRVQQLGQYVDERVKGVAGSGAASSDSHMLILTSLLLADEVFDLRDGIQSLKQQSANADNLQELESIIAESIDNIAKRIDLVAGRIQKA